MEHKDRRGAVRVAKPLEVHYSQDSPYIEARAADISETGLFLETQHPLEVGSKISLRFALPDGNEAVISTTAIVLWVDPLVGVGVAFHGLPDDQRERIKFWVAAEFFGQLSSR